MSGLPDPRDTPFVDVPTAGRLLGVGRSKAFELTHRFRETSGAEGIPVIELGRTLRVPVAALWRLAELDPERDAAPAPTASATVTTFAEPHHKDGHSHGTPVSTP